LPSSDLRDQLQATLSGSYTLERELGGGGMSRVFVAAETALDRKFVIKVLPPETAAQVSPDRFKREILLAAKLQHPHIVPLLTAGESNGLPYFTMPFVDGESLRVPLARHGELPVNQAMRMLREIASALAYAHEHGIVHRDIKPENVLLSGRSAMVTDFGVAKALSASSNTAPGGGMPPPASRGGSGGWGAIAAAAAAVALVIGIATWLLATRTGGGGGSAKLRSIAVLPTDIGADTAHAFLADGLSSDLTTKLSTIPGLSVRAYAPLSVMHGRTVREAGKELGVGAIVMVRMARSGRQLRATASLVNAATADLLWSEAFAASDPAQLALQDTLVSAIARALNLSLSPATTTAVRARGTNSNEAHELVQRARLETDQFTDASLRAAVWQDVAAIALDSN